MTSPSFETIPTPASRRLRLAPFWWVVGWIIVLYITVSCLEPPRYVPDLHVSDKLEHAGAFFGMTFWFGGLVRRRSYALLAVLMLLFGAGIEVAQGLMRLGRTADVWDFAADSVGVAMAFLMIAIGLGSWMWQTERVLGLSREPS